jgi:hypothetical protein
MWCLVGEFDDCLVDKAPSPTFGRIVALDYGVAGLLKMLGSMVTDGVIATSDMTAFPAEPEVYPALSNLQAFLAAQCARFHSVYARSMGARTHRELHPIGCCK